jgi:hypothetical protein
MAPPSPTMLLAQSTTPRPESSATPAPEVISWYASTWGLSQATAQSHLAIEGRGLKMVTWEAEALGKRFGGVWFDNEDGKYYVGIAPGGELAAAQRVGTETDMEENTVYQNVRWSVEELEAANSTVNGELKPLETNHEATVGTDTSADAVEIYLSTATSRPDREFAEEVAKAAPATTTIVEKSPSNFTPHLMACEIHYDGVNGSNDTFCNKPLRTAAGMDDNSNGTECSIGGVVSSASNVYVVTAGHCLKGNLGHYWSTVDASTQERHNLGPAEEAVFGSNGDFGLIKENGSYWEEPYTWYAAIEEQTATYPLEEAIESYQGLYQCWEGAQSIVHYHLSCSTVSRVNVNDGLSEHMDESYGPPEGHGHELCLYAGDSGGGVMSYYNLAGLISAGYNCGELARTRRGTHQHQGSKATTASIL